MLPLSFCGGVSVQVHDLNDCSWGTMSLLHAVVQSNRPSLCGNATVRTLVQYKWQTFGRVLFLKEMSLYCLGLLLLMTLLFIRHDPFRELTATELVKGDLRAKISCVVTVLVLFESLFTLSREFHEMSVLGLKSYLREDWKNSVDFIVIILT